MAVVKLKCPKCNGNVCIEDIMTMGFCKFCGTRVMNDNPVPAKTEKDRTEEIVETLKAARPLLMNRKWEEAEPLVDEVIGIDDSIADTWFMKALIHMNDAMAHEEYRRRARHADRALGVFTQFDMVRLYGHKMKVIFPDTLTTMRDATAVLEVDGKETFTLKYGDYVDFGLTEGVHKVLLKSLVPRNGSVQEFSETVRIEVFKGDRTFYLKSKMLGKGFKLDELFKL